MEEPSEGRAILVAKQVEAYGESVPADFGGVYIEDFVRVVALFTGRLDYHRRRLGGSVLDDQILRLEQVDNSWATLEAIQDDLQPRWRELGIVMSDIDMQRNVVVAGVHPDRGNLADAAKAYPDERVEFRYSGPEPL